MTNEQAKQAFKAAVKGKNLITPIVVRYGCKNGYVYELSRGTDFNNKPVYGITVLTLDQKSTDFDKCTTKPTLTEANDYINSL